MPAEALENDLKKMIGGALGSAMNQAADQKAWYNHIEPRIAEGVGQLHDNITSGLVVRACKTGESVKHLTAQRYLKDSMDELVKTLEAAGLRQLCTFSDLEESDDPIDMDDYSVPYFMRARDRRAHLFYDENSSLHLSVSNRRNGTWVTSNFATTDEAMFKKVSGTLQLSLESRNDEVELEIVSENNRNQLDLVSLGKPASNLIEENYPEKVLKDFKHVTQQLTSDNPDGRLAILHGPPGTGKTYLLRAFMSECNPRTTRVVFFPPEVFSNVNAPSISKLLIENSTSRKMILFIEDGDTCVISRANDNMSVIASLLSFADGFVGSLLDIRIFITTNARKLDIDKALLRPRRLCKIVEVPELEADQAANIYKRLTNGRDDHSFGSRITLADVYHQAAKDGTLEA